MIIKVFPPDAVDFTGYGYGSLPDTLSAFVTEERNGAFDLDLSYPINGLNSDRIVPDNIIFCQARPSDTTGEPFRIYAVETKIDGVLTVKAHHISYDFNFAVFIGSHNGTVTGIRQAVGALNNRRSGADFVRVWFSGFDENDPVVFDIGSIKMLSEAFAGSDNSLLATFGGEIGYEYDPLNQREVATLYVERGSQKPYVVRYGANMTDFEKDENSEKAVTEIVAYLLSDDESQIATHTITLVASPPVVKRMLVNVTGKVAWGATYAEVQAAVTEILAGRDVTTNDLNITTSFVPAKSIGIDETDINLCDKLTVRFDAIDLNTLQEIVYVKFNVMSGHYDKVQLGMIRLSVTDTIAAMKGGVNLTGSGTVTYPVYDGSVT